MPGKSHGRRSLVGCSPWGRKESDTTERLHFHFSLSCTGEGNDNPLQCSCLENSRDGGAQWAAVYGVTQSRTRLKRLSSSSSPPEESPGAPGRVNLEGVKRQTGTGLYKVNTIKYEFLNTNETHMYSSLSLTFVCGGVGGGSPSTHDRDPRRWGETHTVPRPPHLRSHVPNGQDTTAVVSRPPMCKQTRSLGP